MTQAHILTAGHVITYYVPSNEVGKVKHGIGILLRNTDLVSDNREMLSNG